MSVMPLNEIDKANFTLSNHYLAEFKKQGCANSFSPQIKGQSGMISETLHVTILIRKALLYPSGKTENWLKEVLIKTFISPLSPHQEGYLDTLAWIESDWILVWRWLLILIDKLLSGNIICTRIVHKLKVSVI